MLSEHIGMDMVWIDIQSLTDQCSKASCIQRGARSDHATRSNAEAFGVMRGDVSHHVHRVCCDEQNSLGSILQNIWDHSLEHLAFSPPPRQA